MFGDLSDLRDSLFTTRLLREEILLTPVLPADRVWIRDRFLKANAAPPVALAALERALAIGTAPDYLLVDRSDLAALAASVGSSSLRQGPGVPFRGTAAPAPARVPQLLVELLETVNAPAAVETWPPPLRAFALHFLLRLVQPFEAPAEAVAFAGEAVLLAADGFRADRMLLAEATVASEPGAARPEPDAFARARMHRLVERLAESHEVARQAAARAVLLAWIERPEARLTARQARLLRWLSEPGEARRITFREYVALHAGRRAPSLRSLQRDWQGLRDRGLLRAADGDAWVAGSDALALGAG